MKPAHEAFLRAIQKDRYDEDTRRIFADYLDEEGLYDEAEKQRKWTKEWQESYDWMEWFTRDVVTESDARIASIEEVLQAGRHYVDAKKTSCLSGLGFSAENAMMDETTREQFWKCWEILEGRSCEDAVKLNGPFVCGC